MRLPDETPAYCEVTLQAEDLPDEWDIFVENTYRHEIYVFSLPKDRWIHERNQGVAGYLRELDQFYDPEFSRVTVSVRVNQAARLWLTDYYARLTREIEELDAQLMEELGEGGAPAPGTAGDEDHYLSVATSPPPGFRFDPGEQGYFGIGWHMESHHDAGMTAVDECRRQGGGQCHFNASSTSLRGGCIGLAMATWRDRDMDAERTYVVTSSSFRDLIARDLRSGCEGDIFSGKYEDTVVEHSCEIVRIVCAGDTIPAAGTSTPAS